MLLNTLWIGPALGQLERACLRSAMRHGHHVVLYCYARPDGVPEGVEVADAASILPESAIIRHHSGSVSLFSNWFRYELQRRDLGVWIDTDLYFVAPLTDQRPYLFGFQDEKSLNTAILHLPSDAPILSDLLDLFDQKTVPFWLSSRQRLAAWWRLKSTGQTNLSKMPWGVCGPMALTALAKQHNLLPHAVGAEIFYPVPFHRADWIFDPDQRLEDQISENTVTVHLWNESVKSCKDVPARAGSFLARLQNEGC